MVQFRSAAMIVNAKSRKGQKLFQRACAAMDGLDFPVDAHAVENPDDLEATVERALAKKPDLVILGGGDGTVSGLVDLLVGKGVTLAVLPLGTANSFARTLGLPIDVEGAIEVIRTGVPKRIDLGMIDDDYFANCAAMGISPQIAETVPHGLKKVLGRIGYLGWAAWQFVRFKPFMLTIDDGVETHRLRVVEVRISNGPYHGGTWLVDEASVQSGRIVVQAVTGRYKRTLVKNWAASFLGLKARHQDTVSFSGTALKVDTRPSLPISIDGEVLAHTPITARVAAGAIEVMAPA
ncbi:MULTISPECIES: diacylglycerol/lipid kinase family protein [Bacteria]|jgi:YegS/Rv2252/BmrU family lipid kinase|uniref:Diacylglycerol kinase n=2 Tax=Sphingomonas melonis TaxID=152682 RepID=A0A0D1MC28_9SPHN|nr:MULTISPECIES: diacylglycerol kinase family protein [Bacteria]AOW23698.1 diacylglycerol kinase [Sphingomonas melonis TY]ATI54701.1 diacylglycerol kinase [Sphingomonas melonis]KIU29970.1 diacylglycerol kinase [Sphingomonas melonis]KZB96916.1 diacylglycerol kinase [Sphingomonas melonis TY]MBI0531174.1 diacylglycerol kinase [Sphingomonas sp. TX0522]